MPRLLQVGPDKESNVGQEVQYDPDELQDLTSAREALSTAILLIRDVSRSNDLLIDGRFLLGVPTCWLIQRLLLDQFRPHFELV